jgi:hypothetical protein
VTVVTTHYLWRIQLRVGDEVRFRRGASEYVGRVSRLFRGRDLAEVDGSWGVWPIRPTRDLVALEKPVLTQRERHALAVLAGCPDGALGWSLRRQKVASRTLSDLAKRGLVSGLRTGVARDSGPMLWQLTRAGQAARVQLQA